MSRVCVREIATLGPRAMLVVVLQELAAPWRCVALPITRDDATTIMGSERLSRPACAGLRTLHLSHTVRGVRAVITADGSGRTIDLDSAGPDAPETPGHPLHAVTPPTAGTASTVLDTGTAATQNLPGEPQDTPLAEGLATAIHTGMEIHAAEAVFLKEWADVELLTTITALDHPDLRRLRAAQHRAITEQLTIPDLPPVTVVARPSGFRERVGTFAWDLVDDAWVWDDALFALHGYRPGALDPNLEVLLTHADAEDRNRLQNSIAATLAERAGVTSRYRLRTRAGARREVLLMGHTDVVDGRRRLTGFVVGLHDDAPDVVPTAPSAAGSSTDDSNLGNGDVRDGDVGGGDVGGGDVGGGDLAGRAALARATGALMIAFGVPAGPAADMLAWAAHRHHTTVSTVADVLLRTAAVPELIAHLPAAVGDVLLAQTLPV